MQEVQTNSAKLTEREYNEFRQLTNEHNKLLHFIGELEVGYQESKSELLAQQSNVKAQFTQFLDTVRSKYGIADDVKYQFADDGTIVILS